MSIDHPAPAIGRLDPPLFSYGEVHVTPAVKSFLAARGYPLSTVLDPHCRGYFGNLHPGEAEANTQALQNGGQLLSRPVVEGRHLLIITSKISESGIRWTTVVLFEDELHGS